MNYSDLKKFKAQLETERLEQLKKECKYVMWDESPYVVFADLTNDEIKKWSYDEVITQVFTQEVVKKFEATTVQLLRTMVENDVHFDEIEILISPGLVCSEKCLKELDELSTKAMHFQINTTVLLQSVGRMLKFPRIIDGIVPIKFQYGIPGDHDPKIDSMLREFEFSDLVNYNEFIDSMEKLGYNINGPKTFKDYIDKYSESRETQIMCIDCSFEKTKTR